MNKLRPVGTEFDYRFPPAPTSTDPACSVFTYRIIAHVFVPRYPGDPMGEFVEQLEAIAMRREDAEAFGNTEEET